MLKKTFDELLYCAIVIIAVMFRFDEEDFYKLDASEAQQAAQAPAVSF